MAAAALIIAILGLAVGTLALVMAWHYSRPLDEEDG